MLYEFYVPSLVCGGCSKRLTAGLIKQFPENLTPSQIQCDALRHRVSVTTDTTLSDEMLSDEIRGPNTDVPAEPQSKTELNSATLSNQALQTALTKLGFPAYGLTEDKSLKKATQRSFLKRIFVAALGSMQVMMFSVSLYMQQDMPLAWIQAFHWFSLWVTTAVLFYAGRPYFLSASQALAQKQVNMDVPVSIALALAYIYSCWATWYGHDVVYFDSINMFLFLLTLGRFLEWKAKHHAQTATEALWDMVPELAQKKNDQGQIEAVPSRSLKEGDVVLVAHGEPMPADLVLGENTNNKTSDKISNNSFNASASYANQPSIKLSSENESPSNTATVDESLLTGESHPVTKKRGDTLYAGTLNLGPMISGQVAHTASNTRLGQIQQLLMQAQLSRPRIAQLADKIAGHFVAALLLFSSIIGIYWYFTDVSRVIPIVISVLIVTCPCALSLATPTALAAIMAKLAKKGIVVSQSNALEKLRHIDNIVLDKTGTLTQGSFGLCVTTTLSDKSVTDCIEIARALEAGETHPIARAFNTTDETLLGLDSDSESNARTLPASAADKTHHAGRGISGIVSDKRYWLGAGDQLQHLCPQLPDCPIMPQAAKSNQNSQSTTIYLASETQWLACFILADQIKPEAKTIIQQLQSRFPLTLASGDGHEAVQQVAEALNIKHHFARYAPETKTQLLQSLQAEGKKVLMIGDGANDGPVLAQADIGIAMGQGAALAHASADIILLTSDLNRLTDLFSAAKETQNIIKQNLLWALIYNSIALPFAAAGLVPAWAAAIGMSCSSLAVVMNSLRLLRTPNREQKTDLKSKTTHFSS